MLTAGARDSDVLVLLYGGGNDAIAFVNNKSLLDANLSFFPIWLIKPKGTTDEELLNNVKEINPESKDFIVYKSSFDVSDLVARHRTKEFIDADETEQGMRFSEYVIETVHENIKFCKCSDEVDVDFATVNVAVAYKEGAEPKLVYARDPVWQDVCFPK